MVDIKVAFWNGYPETRREVPLHKLSELVAQVAADDESAAELEAVVREAVAFVIDYEGKPQKLVEDDQPFDDESPPAIRVVRTGQITKAGQVFYQDQVRTNNGCPRGALEVMAV